MVNKTKEDEEKKFLAELREELDAIDGQAGEVRKRVKKCRRMITDFERRHEPKLF